MLFIGQIVEIVAFTFILAYHLSRKCICGSDNGATQM